MSLVFTNPELLAAFRYYLQDLLGGPPPLKFVGEVPYKVDEIPFTLEQIPPNEKRYEYMPKPNTDKPQDIKLTEEQQKVMDEIGKALKKRYDEREIPQATISDTKTGWKCPECGAILAPWVEECPHHVPYVGPAVPYSPPYKSPFLPEHPWRFPWTQPGWTKPRLGGGRITCDIQPGDIVWTEGDPFPRIVI